MLLDLDIEPEGAAVILEALKQTTCLRDLQAAFAEPEADAIEFDLAKLVDIEVRAGAGLFFGLCRTIDVARFPNTFHFCFSLLEALNREFERRREGINAN
jgi:hypothetical protein